MHGEIQIGKATRPPKTNCQLLSCLSTSESLCCRWYCSCWVQLHFLDRAVYSGSTAERWNVVPWSWSMVCNNISMTRIVLLVSTRVMDSSKYSCANRSGWLLLKNYAKPATSTCVEKYSSSLLVEDDMEVDWSKNRMCHSSQKHNDFHVTTCRVTVFLETLLQTHYPRSVHTGTYPEVKPFGPVTYLRIWDPHIDRGRISIFSAKAGLWMTVTWIWRWEVESERCSHFTYSPNNLDPSFWNTRPS